MLTTGLNLYKTEKCETMWNLIIVTMYNPLRTKIGDHANIGYHWSHFLQNINTQTIWSLKMVTMYNPLHWKTGDHAYLAYQGSSKIRWPPKKRWPCLLWLLGVSFYKKQKNTKYLKYQNGHHVYAPPLKNRWPCLLCLPRVSFSKKHKNAKYLKFKNGHHV